MPKENEITTIRISKTIKKELQNVALPQEPMGLTIQRLISENKQLKETNENYSKMINMFQQKTIKLTMDKVVDFCNTGSDEFGAYMVIHKITTDLVPSEDERIDALVSNDFINNLIDDGKDDIVLKASELVKEQIVNVGNERYHNQVDIVDKFLEMVVQMETKSEIGLDLANLVDSYEMKSYEV